MKEMLLALTAKEMVLMLTLLGGCELESPKSERCIEFDHHTQHDGIPTKCRMLWCENDTTALKTGTGMAALWCTAEGP